MTEKPKSVNKIFSLDSSFLSPENFIGFLLPLYTFNKFILKAFIQCSMKRKNAYKKKCHGHHLNRMNEWMDTLKPHKWFCTHAVTMMEAVRGKKCKQEIMSNHWEGNCRINTCWRILTILAYYCLVKKFLFTHQQRRSSNRKEGWEVRQEIFLILRPALIESLSCLHMMKVRRLLDGKWFMNVDIHCSLCAYVAPP